MNRQELFIIFEDAMQSVKRQMIKITSGLIDMSPAQMHLLMVLGERGPSTIKQLSEKLDVTSGAITQHVDALEKLELVSRSVNSDNRREVVVSIMPKGWQQFKEMSKKKDVGLNAIFEKLSDDELETLVKLVEKIAKSKYKEGVK